MSSSRSRPATPSNESRAMVNAARDTRQGRAGGHAPPHRAAPRLRDEVPQGRRRGQDRHGAHVRPRRRRRRRSRAEQRRAQGPRLGPVLRPRSAAAVQPQDPPRRLPQLPRLRQRHARRLGRPLARPGALVDRREVSEARSSPPAAARSAGRAVLNEKEQTTDAPDNQVAIYEFESFTATWEHRRFAGNERARSTTIGCYFYGTKGTFHMGWRDGWTFYPANARANRRSTRSPNSTASRTATTSRCSGPTSSRPSTPAPGPSPTSRSATARPR